MTEPASWYGQTRPTQPIQPIQSAYTETPAARLEYLRSQIRAEQISYGEIAELQGLADQIEPGDVELLEWAGVPEHPEGD
jgi:hypothetical protein